MTPGILQFTKDDSCPVFLAFGQAIRAKKPELSVKLTCGKEQLAG